MMSTKTSSALPAYWRAVAGKNGDGGGVSSYSGGNYSYDCNQYTGSNGQVYTDGEYIKRCNEYTTQGSSYSSKKLNLSNDTLLDWGGIIAREIGNDSF